MPKLIARTPLAGMAPVEAGALRLREVVLGSATSVAPFRGREAEVDALLTRALGLGFPAPNRTLARDGARILWSGRSMALLIDAAPPEGLGAMAALTDQTDGLAALAVEGPGVEDALARLVPLDLRASAFAEGHTARTMLWHMTCSVTRTGPQAFEILVMRSMARTAAHDLETALRRVAARV